MKTSGAVARWMLLAALGVGVWHGARCVRAASEGGLAPEAWAAKIHAGWVGKVAAGSGALPTENMTREMIRAKFGDLRTPRGPLDDRCSLQVTGLPREWWIADLARPMAETGAALARGKALPALQASPAASEPIPAPVTAATGQTSPQDPPEGFGASARGGAGGRVITVTSLADSGPGSLREALDASGPRMIHFAVDGTIDLQSRLRVANGQVTIEGGTAPGNGITLRTHGLWFCGDCDDIIVRDLRIRVLTGGTLGDCLLLWGNQGGTVERVLIDHCSLMWATDEVVNTWGNVRDVTCQWSIIAEAQLPHSKAWLSGVGSDRISIHHCLFAQNADRVPKLEGGVYDLVNNVLYNWTVNNAAKVGSGARVNLVNNYFIAGPQSAGEKGCVFPSHLDKGTRVHLSGNIGPFSPTGAEDQWANVTSYENRDGRWVEHHPAPVAYRAADRFPAAPVAEQTAKEAYDLVLARAGAKVRDADDLRVIEEVKARGGRVGRGPH